MKQEILTLLERLKKGHDYYASYYGKPKMQEIVYQKAVPIIKQLVDIGFDETWCLLLFIFGGQFLDSEVEEFIKQKKGLSPSNNQGLLRVVN